MNCVAPSLKEVLNSVGLAVAGGACTDAVTDFQPSGYAFLSYPIVFV